MNQSWSRCRWKWIVEALSVERTLRGLQPSLLLEARSPLHVDWIQRRSPGALSFRSWKSPSQSFQSISRLPLSLLQCPQGNFFFLISFANLLFPRLLSLDLLFCTSVKRSSRQWFPHRYLKAAQRCPPSLRANRALFPQPLLMCFGALKAVITPSLPANEESLCLFGLARCPHLQMENKPPKP